jgi:metallo-beta-lactamase class B
MRPTLPLALATLSLVAACATQAPAPKATQADVDAFVAKATALAGEDLKGIMPVCNPQPALRAGGPAIETYLQRMIAAPPPEPGQAFDNLYFVGSGWVSAWVLKTSQGLILIDAMNNALEASALVEGGMRRLGLDPAQIKYIVVTHGHGDHYGGAAMLAEKYKARVVASVVDWDMMETNLEFDSPQWSKPPKRDIAVKDTETLTLGDTTVTLYMTPGHTKGTLSPVFDVKAGGRTHRAMIWGGTAFNFGRDMERLDSYIAASERMRSVVASRSVDVFLSNHPGNDKTMPNLAALKARPTAPNPFVVGTPTVDRALQVLGTCARAQKARFLIS